MTSGAVLMAGVLGVSMGLGWAVQAPPATQGETQQQPAANVPMDGPGIYAASGCDHCHRYKGKGGMKGPNLTVVGRRLREDQIHQRITDGSGAMPSFQDALTAGQVDALTAWLAKQK